MSKIKFYHFWDYDGKTDESTLSPTKRTAADIKRMNRQPILESEEKVDEADLGKYGRYDPKKPLAKR